MAKESGLLFTVSDRKCLKKGDRTREAVLKVNPRMKDSWPRNPERREKVIQTIQRPIKGMKKEVSRWNLT